MKYLLEGEETERLKFRLLEEGDFRDWAPLFRIENVAEFLALDSSLSENELCALWFEKIFHRYENDLGGMNVLIDKQTGRLVGQCGLLVQSVEEVQRLEIGYSILPEFWGIGYASEAAQKCKDYAFSNDLANSLISMVHVDNIRSEKVARKNGMSLERTLENYKGTRANIFSINKNEWLARE
ncbi:Protein N-acetyltransferase, RimJ/RimL family [Salinimicrobium catena]|uniref:Protein N-acetyltransferase, RimJ/RimL family n=1 Tax=Salinimicrobium catena TaxID=390640 RepID=A0A1H5J2K8_9FLAO|nr:GNAT family N-acetyltransferase [Salinimicrobium catena]SDK82685.1 Protein N-acetyltransferase, RimJ/RimL family [Salinimicrobium catena]SEE45888.1 Protein N-acetyltransferase, RimJ/RimL family [Salinimicrobium catena]